MNYIYLGAFLVVFAFIVYIIVVRSKFQPGKEIQYKFRSRVEKGRIEYVGENCVMVNNLYIKKTDVL